MSNVSEDWIFITEVTLTFLIEVTEQFSLPFQYIQC